MVVVGGAVVGATVVEGGTDDVVDTRNVVVGLAVVEGTTVVSGEVDEVVSTVGCVSAGGGGMVMGTVEEEVEVEVVELVCSTDVSVRVVSVDVGVGAGDDTHAKESSNQRSGSAGTENPVTGLPSFASTTTVVSQHEPSTVLAPVVPSL